MGDRREAVAQAIWRQDAYAVLPASRWSWNDIGSGWREHYTELAASAIATFALRDKQNPSVPIGVTMAEQLHTLRGVANCYAGNEMAEIVHAWINEVQGVLIAATQGAR